jgi:hypothetical protein
MDGVSQAQAGASIDAVNRLLETATSAVIRQVDKMMKVAVEMAVGIEAGKGQNIDVFA